MRTRLSPVTDARVTEVRRSEPRGWGGRGRGGGGPAPRRIARKGGSLDLRYSARLTFTSHYVTPCTHFSLGSGTPTPPRTPPGLGGDRHICGCSSPTLLHASQAGPARAASAYFLARRGAATPGLLAPPSSGRGGTSSGPRVGTPLGPDRA